MEAEIAMPHFGSIVHLAAERKDIILCYFTIHITEVEEPTYEMSKQIQSTLLNTVELTKKGLKPLYKCSWCKEQDHNKLEEGLAVPLEVYTYNQQVQPKRNSD